MIVKAAICPTNYQNNSQPSSWYFYHTDKPTHDKMSQIKKQSHHQPFDQQPTNQLTDRPTNLPRKKVTSRYASEELKATISSYSVNS